MLGKRSGPGGGHGDDIIVKFLDGREATVEARPSPGGGGEGTIVLPRAPWARLPPNTLVRPGRWLLQAGMSVLFEEGTLVTEDGVSLSEQNVPHVDIPRRHHRRGGPTLAESEITFPENFTVPEGGFLIGPAGTTLSDGSILPSGSDFPGGVVLPNGILLADGTELPKNIHLAEGQSLPGGNKVPERTEEEKKEDEVVAAEAAVKVKKVDEEGCNCFHLRWLCMERVAHSHE
ncbi:uncharacterized protein E0L32_008210 [Thyridium curvatum]|uniref:Uncharacterized protein n=1 Tax=Thyridium curvatum TaxID=1093900 RepID=A0A507B119_9PEZI|nr:uncharacterized protein E0L32_008210 [Thyridium curvatum]TPX10821.1 hypothetical protein E0L32_008210 [Thyridium curvatum]